jgi:hypothetical protein
VAGHLLVVARGVNLSHARPARQMVQTVSPENAVDIGIRHRDGVIALEIPHDPDWSEVICPSKVQHLLLDRGSGLVGWVLRDRLLVDQSVLAMSAIGCLPTIEARPANAEVATCLTHIAGDIRVLKNAQFALDLSLVLFHRNNPFSQTQVEERMSRKLLHFYNSLVFVGGRRTHSKVGCRSRAPSGSGRSGLGKIRILAVAPASRRLEHHSARAETKLSVSSTLARQSRRICDISRYATQDHLR